MSESEGDADLSLRVGRLVAEEWQLRHQEPADEHAIEEAIEGVQRRRLKDACALEQKTFHVRSQMTFLLTQKDLDPESIRRLGHLKIERHRLCSREIEISEAAKKEIEALKEVSQEAENKRTCRLLAIGKQIEKALTEALPRLHA